MGSGVSRVTRVWAYTLDEIPTPKATTAIHETRYFTAFPPIGLLPLTPKIIHNRFFLRSFALYVSHLKIQLQPELNMPQTTRPEYRVSRVRRSTRTTELSARALGRIEYEGS